MRKSGILLPIASLPSKYGIGTFSKSAYEFVDFLEKAGQSYWQILPIGPTGYGDSPYQSFSTFAGNPYFIDLDRLVEEGWLTKEDCEEADATVNPEYVEYEKVYLTRFVVLRKAYENSKIAENVQFQNFVRENAFWLEDYSLYMAIKNEYEGKSWIFWDDDIKMRNQQAMDSYRFKLKKEIEFYQFQQYLFAAQWKELKEYANKKGIRFIGDLPIYVAFDSTDAWANPKLFQFDEKCEPTGVAGCPPDAYAVTGQLWGNPLYRWDYHKETGFDWWMQRLDYCFKLYDVVRIDHFRGFDEYYNIPYGDKTAEFGKWETGPGYAIFETMKNRLGDKAVIAEDLGFLTQSVLDLVDKTGYPGMKVLHFAFDSGSSSAYLPHNYSPNSISYTGTHDNDTNIGWLNSQSDGVLEFTRKYLGVKKDADIKELSWEMIRAVIASVSESAVIQMQDYLELGSEARTNIPSTVGNNWKWRMKEGVLTDALAEKIKNLTDMYGRN